MILLVYPFCLLPFKKKEATYTMCCNSYNVQIIWINTIRLKFDVEAHLKN